MTLFAFKQISLRVRAFPFPVLMCPTAKLAFKDT